MYLFVFQVKFNSNFLLYLHSHYIFRLIDVFRYRNKRLYSAFVITVNKEALHMVCSLFLSIKQYWPVTIEVVAKSSMLRVQLNIELRFYSCKL